MKRMSGSPGDRQSSIFGINRIVQPTLKAAGASLGYDPFTSSLKNTRAPNSSKQPKLSRKTYAKKSY